MMTAQEIANAVLHLEGWCTYEKASAIAGLVLKTRPSLCVELGVFGGRSLAAIALALRENGRGLVYGIDPWTREACLEGRNDPANDRWWAEVDLERVHNRAMINLNALCLWPRLRIIAAPSWCVVSALKDGSVDLLHADANHSAEASVRDLNLYLPKLKPGGYLILDDTDWQTMASAVDLAKNHCDLVAHHKTWELYSRRLR